MKKKKKIKETRGLVELEQENIGSKKENVEELFNPSYIALLNIFTP